MDNLDPVESNRLLRKIVSTLVLLLIVSNAIWFIAYTTATGPLAKPTPTVTITPLSTTRTLTPTPQPTTTTTTTTTVVATPTPTM